jgi:hypothetical protein
MGDEVLCIGLLGVFSISAGDSVIADDAWRLRKAKTLIKLLALAPERRLHVDQAGELLWAERDPDSARNNLHQAIFAARRALDSIGLDGSRYLELREELILLSPEDPVRIDTVAFEELAAAAREQGEPGAYRSALEGFDAELLPADRYEDWSRERRDSLDQLRLALEAELAELEQDSEPHRAGASRPELPSQLTSFVGRECALAEVATLLRDARLLTLTGAGGCARPGWRCSSPGSGERTLPTGSGRSSWRRSESPSWSGRRSLRRWTHGWRPTGRRRSRSPGTSAIAGCCSCSTTVSTWSRRSRASPRLCSAVART